MKSITKMKIPGGISVLNWRRSLDLKKYEVCICSTTKGQFSSTFGMKRNIFTCGKLHSESFNPRILDINSVVDDEIKINSVLQLSADKFDGFRAACSKQVKYLSTHLQTESIRAAQMTNQEWDAIKDVVLKMPGTINDKNIDALIMNKCAELKLLSLGKSYFKYLKSTNKLINQATYGNYLRLFFSCESDCTSDDLNEIVVVYEELLNVHPIIDSYTAEKAVCALCLTPNWKEYEKLFIAIKQLYHPTIFTYKAVILTAFDNQEFEQGWKLMEEMQYQGLNVPEEVFLYWFQTVKSRKLEKDIIRVLNFFNYFNVKPSDVVCEGIKTAYKEYNEGGRVTFTNIVRNGECRSCRSKLEPCNVSQEDYDELKKTFLNPVIVGKDIFQKTRPEEFKEFLEFLKKSAPFDVILDGLNIALGGRVRSTSEFTFRLKSVVKHFVTLNKKVLVLGRKHMVKWQTPDMELVFKNAHVFLTDNLSQDDPFMLYAALYSGLGTCFVSRDLMRGHKFLLADQKLQNIFQKWQYKHQYFITNIERNGRVYFQETVSFLQTVQQNSKGDWHIPYVIKGEELSERDRVDHLHRHWLCLQKTSSQATPRPRRPEEPSFKPRKIVDIEKPIKKLTGKINLKDVFKEDDR